MGKHIHTRIFLLVLAVILFLTLGAGLIFRHHLQDMWNTLPGGMEKL